MATARAIANGNWSATSTWNGGVLPGNGDTVYANGFNVTINQDILIGGANNPTVNAGSFVSGQWYEVLFVGTTSWTGIGAASNTAGTIFLATGVGSGTGNARALATLTTAANTPAGAAAGGSFAMSATYTLTADIRASTTACLVVTGATNITLDGLRVFGGSATGTHGCNFNSTGTATLANSTFTATGTGSGGIGFNNASTGIVTVSAPCIFNGGGFTAGLNNNSTGTVTVNASCTFNGGNSTGACGLNNNSTGTVTVNASCTFNGGVTTNTGGVNNSSTGTITVNAPCNFNAASASGGFALINASTGTLIVANSTFTASAFSAAVSAANTSADVRLSGDFLDHWSGWKAVSGSKWRLGTTPTAARTRYALAGTTDSYVEMFTADNTGFGLPAATDVRSGVSYGGGAVTGLCAVPAAASTAFGVPVDNTTGTAVLTPAAIRSELSVELGRIDAAISSRLAPSGTLATVTTLTNAPTVPTAAAIATQVRTELSSELSKVAALNTTRLGQVTTTEILGNLLAQANS